MSYILESKNTGTRNKEREPYEVFYIDFFDYLSGMFGSILAYMISVLEYFGHTKCL